MTKTKPVKAWAIVNSEGLIWLNTAATTKRKCLDNAFGTSDPLSKMKLYKCSCEKIEIRRVEK